MISAGGGATGALHDFDRPSGCEKKIGSKENYSYSTSTSDYALAGLQK